ncbi:hypothetical protein [Salinispora arenicola]|uniref:hypothetical protein n=1 Tax=Salinispora arenicola TaxID=168697 RepID=UPI0027DE159E|nr:hypothetical protein [Salinispora arenicola]
MAGEFIEVAVIAGTPYDSGLGTDLLRAEGVAAAPYATAGSPDEQDSMQDQRPDALAASFQRLLHELRRRQVELAMVFCNSLSSVVNHDSTALPVVSPLTVDRDVCLGCGPRWCLPETLTPCSVSNAPLGSPALATAC